MTYYNIHPDIHKTCPHTTLHNISFLPFAGNELNLNLVQSLFGVFTSG